MTTPYYTTQGEVRGCCGHRHRSIEAAHRCLVNDQLGCSRQHGYSDRNVYEVDEQGQWQQLVQTGDGDSHYERLPDVV